VLLLAITGCAQMPGQFVLAPNLQVPSMKAGQALSHSVTVNDMRAYQYLLTLEHGQEKRQLLNSDRAPEQVIRATLSNALASNKVALTAVDYRVEIAELLINVKQRSLKFESNSSIVLLVNINKGDGELSKTFKRTGNSYGPLKADIAVIERDFNLLLGQLLQDIANDQELLQYINR